MESQVSLVDQMLEKMTYWPPTLTVTGIRVRAVTGGPVEFSGSGAPGLVAETRGKRIISR